MLERLVVVPKKETNGEEEMISFEGGKWKAQNMREKIISIDSKHFCIF